MAECPEGPLKAYRKSLIGRGKPLTAKQADSAIRGAQHVLATGALSGKGKGAKREIESEPVADKLSRGLWYLRQGLPLVLARPYGYTWTPSEIKVIKIAKEKGIAIKCLQWDGDEVHRTEDDL